MAANQMFIHNKPRKSVYNRFPRLTGKSAILIAKYMANVGADSLPLEYMDDRYEIDNISGIDLGEFLMITAYFNLPQRALLEQYSQIRGGNELRDPKEDDYSPDYDAADRVFQYYKHRGLNRSKILDLIQIAISEGYMTYDKPPFMGSVVLSGEGIWDSSNIIRESMFDFPQQIQSESESESDDEIFENWSLSLFIAPRIFGYWESPFNWDELLFSSAHHAYISYMNLLYNNLNDEDYEIANSIVGMFEYLVPQLEEIIDEYIQRLTINFKNFDSITVELR